MMQHFFKSKEWKEGWNARKSGLSSLCNPYSQQATDDNLRRGMGASPWWDTQYKPFIRWDQGWRDAFNPDLTRNLQ